eukprot:TRINITY_DN67972_c5_g1_i1.p1 TRINITY_DN67972_c5_g1~~TRINITY_DN67972_c5_g1_i1.p1  ORF type:complete len:405 (-),score=64.30 TRINITY_DN67972_c5_g1_i1:79-1293(-)
MLVVAAVLSLVTFSSAVRFDPCPPDATITETGRGWMSQLKDSTLLGDLTIPGTHDTGSYSFTENWYVGAAKGARWRFYSGTQCMTLLQQLNSGVRFLDLRVATASDDTSSLLLFHGSSYIKTVTAESLFTVVKDFLTNYPKEAIFARVKWDNGESDGSLVKSTLTSSGLHSLIMEMSSSKLGPMQLKDVRGKFILIKEVYTETDPKFYTYTWADAASGVTLRDDWENKQLLADSQDSKWVTDWTHVKDTVTTATDNAFYITFFSGSSWGATHVAQATDSNTENVPGTEPLEVAESANPYIKQQIGDATWDKLGVIAMDFPPADLIQKLVQINDQHKDDAAAAIPDATAATTTEPDIGPIVQGGTVGDDDDEPTPPTTPSPSGSGANAFQVPFVVLAACFVVLLG